MTKLPLGIGSVYDRDQSTVRRVKGLHCYRLVGLVSDIDLRPARYAVCPALDVVVLIAIENGITFCQELRVVVDDSGCVGTVDYLEADPLLLVGCLACSASYQDETAGADQSKSSSGRL